MKSQENHYNGCSKNLGETQGFFSLKHEAGVLIETTWTLWRHRLEPVSCQLYSKKTRPKQQQNPGGPVQF